MTQDVVIAENLQDLLTEAREKSMSRAWRNVGDLIERISKAKSEVANLKEQLRLAQPTSLQWQDLLSERDALKEQVRELTQPVSDEEWTDQGFKGNQNHWRETLNEIIAARAK